MTGQQAAFSLATLLNIGLIALVSIGAVIRMLFIDSGDKYRCKALLHRGQWLDAGNSNWQPEGCMLNSYNPKQISTCLHNQRVVFVGDSTAREVFQGTASILSPQYTESTEKHSDQSLSLDGVSLEFIWDPFLNASATQTLLRGSRSYPSMLVISSGLWYLRWPESGGRAAWSKTVDQIFTAVSPKSPRIADEVVLLPVRVPHEEKLSVERSAYLNTADVNKMNNDLYTRAVLLDSYEALPSLSIPKVFNTMLADADGQTEDGLHYTKAIKKIQANILLNLRCNDELPKQFPLDKTCCRQYPSINWVQLLLILFLIVYAPVGMHLYASHSRLTKFFPAQQYLQPLAIFGFSIVLIFFADRTSFFLKEGKQYNVYQFGALCLASLGLGLFTMKKPEKGDLGFLNRDQTDEWKGWMQIAILIYHYLGASKISGIYNPIRVLVAAYLFMTGYGHMFFYYKKGDFGLARIAGVVVRLNLLTIALTYVMDTDWLSYYFSPLVTMWFGIIWVTMFIGNKYNKKLSFLVTKLAISAGLVAWFFAADGALAAVFWVTNTFCKTEWNAKEWAFRVTLDQYIVYIGMLAALAYIKIGEMHLTERQWWPSAVKGSIIGSAIVMALFFFLELQYPKTQYNHYHPYLSFLPVIAFAVLRNATPFLRSTSSKAFIWIGQCSLETFICQFHLWLAADTKGILIALPGTRWRPINFILTTLVFLFISNQIASATGSLTEWICGSGKKKPAARAPLPSSQTGAEYVALNSVHDPTKSPISPVSDTIMAPSSPAPGAPGTHTAYPEQVSRVLQVLSEDLRVKGLLILIVLTALNWMYPGVQERTHLFPTHSE